MVSEVIKEVICGKFRKAGIDLEKQNISKMRIYDPRFYERVMKQSSLGLGESYMDGWWDAENLDQVIHDILKADLDSCAKPSLKQMLHISKYLLLESADKAESTCGGQGTLRCRQRFIYQNAR